MCNCNLQLKGRFIHLLIKRALHSNLCSESQSKSSLLSVCTQYIIIKNNINETHNTFNIIFTYFARPCKTTHYLIYHSSLLVWPGPARYQNCGRAEHGGQ